MKTMNTNKLMRQLRSRCARCNHPFGENEFKVKTDNDEFICECCRDKVR